MCDNAGQQSSERKFDQLSDSVWLVLGVWSTFILKILDIGTEDKHLWLVSELRGLNSTVM